MIPCMKLKIPVIWIDRKKEGWPQGQKGKPTRDREDLRSAVKLLGALSRSRQSADGDSLPPRVK